MERSKITIGGIHIARNEKRKILKSNMNARSINGQDVHFKGGSRALRCRLKMHRSLKKVQNISF